MGNILSPSSSVPLSSSTSSSLQNNDCDDTDGHKQLYFDSSVNIDIINPNTDDDNTTTLQPHTIINGSVVSAANGNSDDYLSHYNTTANYHTNKILHTTDENGAHIMCNKNLLATTATTETNNANSIIRHQQWNENIKLAYTVPLSDYIYVELKLLPSSIKNIHRQLQQQQQNTISSDPINSTSEDESKTPHVIIDLSQSEPVPNNNNNETSKSQQAATATAETNPDETVDNIVHISPHNDGAISSFMYVRDDSDYLITMQETIEFAKKAIEYNIEKMIRENNNSNNNNNNKENGYVRVSSDAFWAICKTRLDSVQKLRKILKTKDAAKMRAAIETCIEEILGDLCHETDIINILQ